MTDRTYTPAQRRALLALTGEWKSNPAGISTSECHALVRWCPDLCQRERFRRWAFVHPNPYVLYWRLTPTGLAEKERIARDDRR